MSDVYTTDPLASFKAQLKIAKAGLGKGLDGISVVLQGLARGPAYDVLKPQWIALREKLSEMRALQELCKVKQFIPDLPQVDGAVTAFLMELEYLMYYYREQASISDMFHEAVASFSLTIRDLLRIRLLDLYLRDYAKFVVCCTEFLMVHAPGTHTCLEFREMFSEVQQVEPTVKDLQLEVAALREQLAGAPAPAASAPAMQDNAAKISDLQQEIVLLRTFAETSDDQDKAFDAILKVSAKEAELEALLRQL